MAVRVPATLATIKVNPSGGVAKVLKNTSCVAGAMMLGTPSSVPFLGNQSSNTEKTSQRSRTLHALSGFRNENYASASLEKNAFYGMCWRCAAFVLLVRVWTRFSLLVVEVVPPRCPLIDVILSVLRQM